jgi:ACDE family multidrug resistance protein
VPRPVASATYGFVRFIGGGLAPFAAGLLAEHVSVHVPFLLGAVVVLAGAVLLQTVRGDLDGSSETPEEARESVTEVPTLEEEAVIAQKR